MIKYQYAKDEKGKLIDIKSLEEKANYSSRYFCFGCGNELIARLGKIKIHHFAHKKVAACSGETYLHFLGKQLFFDNYTECLSNNTPFFIELYQKSTCNHYEQDFGIKCKIDKYLTKFDLTKYFNEISLESREGSFVADVLLKSKLFKDTVFVEIAVTHLSTEQKLNSNYRIIEIKIEKEDDLEPIKRKLLSINDSRVKFKNFKTKDINTSICKGNCSINHNFLTLDIDGRCLLNQKNLKLIKYILKADVKKIVKYEITADNGHHYSTIFKEGVATFASNKLKIRNCFICRYHALYNSWDHSNDAGILIFCKFLKIVCNSNNAVYCKYFKLEETIVTQLLSTRLKTKTGIKENNQEESEEDYENRDN